MGLLDLLKKKQVTKETRTETEVKTYNREFKVVGVTFTNDDNVPRQEILEAIKERRKPFNKRLDVLLKGYLFEGKPAISVNVNGQCIGNISKEDLPFLLENENRIMGINNLYVGGDKSLYWARVKVILKTKKQ